MNRNLIFAFFLLTLTGSAMPQEYLVSVGLKLGYTWGNGSGSFNTGGEISMIFFKDENLIYPLGIVIDYEYISHLNGSKLHLGIEKNFRLFGVDIGPSVLFGNENKLGISFIPYAGILLIPYADFSFFEGISTQSAGTYLKFPVMTNIDFSLGG